MSQKNKVLETDFLKISFLLIKYKKRDIEYLKRRFNV